MGVGVGKSVRTVGDISACLRNFYTPESRLCADQLDLLQEFMKEARPKLHEPYSHECKVCEHRRGHDPHCVLGHIEAFLD